METKPILESQSGSALLYVLLFSALVGMMALVIPQVIRRNVKVALNDRLLFEAETVASNLLEVGKYLILYERVIFQTDPLSLGGDRDARGRALQGLLGQPFGSFSPGSEDILNACGFYDASGTFAGNFRVAGERVFCPIYLRTSLLSGGVLEQLLFDAYLTQGVLESNRPGSYQMFIDFDRSLKEDEQQNLVIPLNFGESVMDLMDNATLFNFSAENRIQPASLRFDFMTDSSRFASVSSERFVKITATIRFNARAEGDNQGRTYLREKSETIIMAASTPASFALFNPYPRRPGFNDPAATAAETNVFSDAVVTQPGRTVGFNGRVYFNGDLTVPDSDDWSSLPDFNESVILSGQLLLEGTTDVPGPDAIEKIKGKFKKGVVTNFSANRYLLDGSCESGSGISTANNSLMGCGRQGGAPGASNGNALATYLRARCKTQTGINLQDAEVSPGDLRIQGGMIPPAIPVIDDFEGRKFLSGCFRNVDVKAVGSDFSLVSTPALNFTIRDGARPVGVVFGGSVNVMGDAQFYTLTNLSETTPGLVPGELPQINAASINAIEGVTVPLLNMPVLTSVGSEENQ